MRFTTSMFHLFFLSLLLLSPLNAYKVDGPKSAIKEALEFQNEVKQLEAQRMKAHEELKAKRGTPQQHKAIDDDALSKARKLEAKRTSSLKKLAKKAGINEIGQGKYGTKPTEGRGAFGDIDTPNYSGKDFEKIRAAAKKAGYTVTSDGDTIHIKELDTTVHREPSKFKSKTGSSAADAEAAGGYGKETSRKLKTGDKTTEVLDNLGKSGDTLNKPTNKMKSSDWQEMGKMTGRNMDAADIVDPKFREQLEMLKKGYRPESVGIDDMDAFQQKCRKLNNQAAKNVRTQAKIKEVKLKEKLTQAKSDMKKAQQSGDIKKIKKASEKIKRTQNEIAEHSQTQKAAEDSLKKNQPEKAKDILEETKPPPKEEIDDMIKQERTGRKTKTSTDADDMIKKPKAPSDADDMIGKPSKQSKVTAPSGGKKNYVKIAKNAATGAIVAITFFSGAEDVKQKLKKGDIKGAGKIIADNLTGGAITITEQNVEKYNDYQEFKNKIDYANKTEYEAYILRVGKALREKGLSVDETNKIMSDMHNENLTSYKSALSNLHKQGKSISVKPPHLTARTWSSFYDNADEGLGLRTYHVFKAIGDGIRAMPGKAKKFLSETNDDLYEIFGGIKRDKDGKLNINKGIFEKGVATELYNQKVESAKNLLDIAKNEYRAYEVNKEIEEQKERKDKFALQKDLRESLIKQGYSPDEANAIAKKAAQNGDWEAYREARNRVHNLIKVKEQAKKNGVYSEDMQEYIACACHNSECSMMWRSYKENGVCACEGPLFGHEIPISTSKKVLYSCINQITKKNYEDDLKIFDEMRASDAKIAKKRELNKEKKYQKLLKIIQAKNAKAVEKDLQKVKQLMQKDETLTKAAELFAQIKEFLYPRDRKLSKNLIYSLSRYADPLLVNGKIQEAINIVQAAKGVPTNQYEQKEVDNRIASYKQWQKTWESVKETIFPKIYDDLENNRIQSALAKKPLADPFLLHAPSFSSYSASYQSPEWISLRDAISKKNEEYLEARNYTYWYYQEFWDVRAYKDAMNTVIHLLNTTWEFDPTTKATLERMLSKARRQVEFIQSEREKGARTDQFNKKRGYKAILKEYLGGLEKYQGSSKRGQKELNELNKRYEIAMKYKKDGDTQLKKQKLSKALGQYKKSVTYWPNSKLNSLIKQLEKRLAQEKRQAELEAKIAKLEREKARQEEEAMTSAGLDFGNRFGARESRRTEQVQEKQNRDVYAGNSERADDQEEMLKRLKQNLEKIKATIPVHVAKPVASAWIPPRTSSPSSGSDTTSSTAVTTQPSATATPITGISTIATPTKLSGTFKGIWYSTDKGEKLSGTVSIKLTGKGTIHVQYFGDDEDSFDAPIGTSGNINIKADDGETVFSGKITRGSNGQLQGNGHWYMMNRHGIWKNKTSAQTTKPGSTPAQTTSTSNTVRDGLYTGTYSDEHLNTRNEKCQNHSGKLSIIVKGKRFSGDGSGTIDATGHLKGTFNNGYKANGAYFPALKHNGVAIYDVIMGFISGPPYCTAALDLRKDKTGKKTYTPAKVTKAPKATPKWVLINTIIYTEPKDSSSYYDTSLQLKNGSFKYRKAPKDNLNYAFSVEGLWHGVPRVMVPNQNYNIDVSIKRLSTTNYAFDTYIQLAMDSYDIGCGAKSSSKVSLSKSDTKVGWRESDQTSKSWRGSFKAPEFGVHGSRSSKKIQIKANTAGGCVRYIYQWKE